MKKLILFFIGSDFYMKSGTMMSPIYEAKTYSRYDWAFLERELRNGKQVTIRPANKKRNEVGN